MSHPYSHYEIQDYFCKDQSDYCSSLVTKKQAKQENSTYDSLRGKKLMKNRICAQKTRLKKKKHIDELQKSQRDLIRQIEQTQKQIEKTNQELNAFLTKNKQNDSFNHDEKPTYERLKSLIRSEQEHFDQDEAMMLIELLINRVGVTGKERRRMTDYYSKRLVNFSIPAIYRYMLHASTENKGLLAEEKSAMYSWDEELYERVVLEEGQKAALLRNRQRVANEKQSWINKIQAFEEIRSEIYTISYKVEESLLGMKEMLNPRQMGEIIIRIENRKYNKDLSLGEKQLTSPITGEEKKSKKPKKGEEGFEKQVASKKVKVQE